MILENLSKFVKSIDHGEICEENAFNSSVLVIEDSDIIKILLVHKLDKIKINKVDYPSSKKNQKLDISFYGNYLEIIRSRLFYEDKFDYKDSINHATILIGESPKILVYDIPEGMKYIREKLKSYLESSIKNENSGKQNSNSGE